MRNWLTIATIVVLAGSGSANAQTLGVAERLAAEIRAVLPGASVNIPDPLGLNITYAGQTRPVDIRSVHEACALGATSCDAAIRSYAQRAASYMLETAPLLRNQLRIVVRSKSYLEKMREQMGTSDDFISEPLVGDVVRVCYRDLPQGRRPIVAADLPALKLDRSAALAECMGTSRSAVAPLASLWKTLPEKGIGVIQNGDDVTGYLAASEDWRTLAEQLGGLVVAAPGVDTLIYGRGSNAIDIDALATLAKQMHADASVPVSGQVFRWTDRGWVVLQR